MPHEWYVLVQSSHCSNIAFHFAWMPSADTDFQNNRKCIIRIFCLTSLYLTGTLTKEKWILRTSTSNRQNPLSRSLRNAGILALGIRRCIATPGPMALDTHENQHPSILRFSPQNQIRFTWSHRHFGSYPQRLRWRPNGPEGKRWIEDSEPIDWRIIRANLQIKNQHFTDFQQ